jgi:pyruvate/2-oxoglutarate dehydrogenase complex dihydrolipoamide acyltransferase (E2) component
MKTQLKLMRVGMNMEEATVCAWHKAAGESFNKGEALYDIETEKVTMAVEAPCDGVLLEIFVPAGSNAAVGDVVCAIDQAPARG